MDGIQGMRLNFKKQFTGGFRGLGSCLLPQRPILLSQQPRWSWAITSYLTFGKKLRYKATYDLAVQLTLVKLCCFLKLQSSLKTGKHLKKKYLQTCLSWTKTKLELWTKCLSLSTLSEKQPTLVNTRGGELRSGDEMSVENS